MGAPSERLKETRVKAGFRSAAQFAKRVDVNEVTYRSHEAPPDSPAHRDFDEMYAKLYAKALGVNWLWLLYDEVTPGKASSEAVPVRKNDLPKANANAPMAPVYASAEGGNGEMSVTRSEIVEYKTPPPRYESVKGLYGFYVVGESMLPRIQPGELVWVTPHRKPNLGQEAVFFERENESGESKVMVKEFIGSKGGYWLARQYNPPKEYKLDKDIWDCHLIVGIDLNR